MSADDRERPEDLPTRFAALEAELASLAQENRELRESGARLERSQAMAHVGNWELELGTGKIWASAEAFRIYGLDRKSPYLSLDEAQALVSAEDRRRVDEAMRALVEDHRPYDVVFTIVPADGRGPRVLHSVGSLQLDAAGAPLSILGVLQDVTEQRRIEDVLRTLSQAVEQSPTSIVVTDAAGRIEYVNPKFTALTGYTLSEAMGQNPRILKSGRTPPEVYAGMWQTLAAGREWRGELQNRKKNGDLYWERAVIAPIVDARGMVSHFVAVKEDITEQRGLEAQLRQSQKMEAVGQLAGGIAHDFNNLLSVVQSYTSLAIDGLSGADPLREDLMEVARAAQRAADLTRQLLAFSRRQVLRPRVLNLNDSLRGMERMLLRLIGEEVELTTVAAPELAPVRADPGQIEQVIVNLAVNARDAMPEGGKLTIETSDAVVDEVCARDLPGLSLGLYVKLAISDTGVGMDEGTQSRIFEPFFTTKDLGKGTGLGLSTVLGIVQQSGGGVRVVSAPGRGTTFEVYLPISGGTVEPGTARPAPLVPRSTGETILVTEDEPQLLLLVRGILQRRGYDVLSAGTPEEALALAAKHKGKIHLLLTDVILPSMNGRQLAERIVSGRPELKVLYMSGYAGSIIAERGVIEDGTEFLPKPFTHVTLLAKVREVLGT